MDCPFLTENKYGKEMMEAYRSGDFERAKNICSTMCSIRNQQVKEVIFTLILFIALSILTPDSPPKHKY